MRRKRVRMAEVQIGNETHSQCASTISRRDKPWALTTGLGLNDFADEIAAMAPDTASADPDFDRLGNEDESKLGYRERETVQQLAQSRPSKTQRE